MLFPGEHCTYLLGENTARRLIKSAKNPDISFNGISWHLPECPTMPMRVQIRTHGQAMEVVKLHFDVKI